MCALYGCRTTSEDTQNTQHKKRHIMCFCLSLYTKRNEKTFSVAVQRGWEKLTASTTMNISSMLTSSIVLFFCSYGMYGFCEMFQLFCCCCFVVCKNVARSLWAAAPRTDTTMLWKKNRKKQQRTDGMKNNAKNPCWRWMVKSLPSSSPNNLAVCNVYSFCFVISFVVNALRLVFCFIYLFLFMFISLSFFHWCWCRLMFDNKDSACI